MRAEVVSRRIRRLVRMAISGDLGTAAWAYRAHRAVRNQLQVRGIGELRFGRPPAARASARSVATAVLSARRATCLEAALVLQRFDAAAGRQRDLIIGVTSPSNGFRAHAWLDGDTQRDSSLHEIQRFGVNDR